ncbi:hypothetical protein [Salisediminibacterium halotolerans]|uniref:hypothetical protein n=1 Tax=Salisediminibacterium halotolerans TaxID=517425 RepID=UPI000EB54F03|nr:hypothetical protein [Salisediminibacterium halotolerans]RLJ78281.1 hypothetical protein BCL39_0752 [Actinophytocola xinjiangensis]RPE88380.1 hypothetical protein EDD67_0707 [Salisediminibacterium halotolerans]TWG37258.1 hypothetical protein BCL52_0751 [Salisediminibacterium halotolerans]GEL07737.1 hypothetical protein SHA02_11530 [Salisediminibacterium halotolerans]
MSEARYEFFRKHTIRQLNAEDQRFIKTYETMENKLIDLAASEEELLELMINQRVFARLGQRFKLSADQAYQRLQALEMAIEDKTAALMNQMSYRDITHVYKTKRSQPANSKHYLLTSESSPSANT